jgi:hypothetical protein
MSNPKKHHFVPSGYLSFWEDEGGFVHLYDFLSEVWRRQKPQKTMRINKYYRQESAPDGVDPNVMEINLGQKLEAISIDSISKIKNEISLNDDETSALLIYVEMQRMRVPKQGEEAKRLLKYFLERTGETIPEVRGPLRRGDVYIEVYDSFRFDYYQMVIGSMHPFLTKMEWVVWVSEDLAANFITSDNPVIFVNFGLESPYEAGPGLAGSTVLFPLGPNHMLEMKHPEFINGEIKDPLHKFDVPPEEDGFIKITYMQSKGPEHVRALNRAVIGDSDRLICGNSKKDLEFSLGFEIAGH